MKSLVTTQHVTKLTWDVVPPRIIHADRPLVNASQIVDIEAIINAIHEPVLILTKTLIIQSANKAFSHTFRTRKNTILGMSLHDLVKEKPQLELLVNQLHLLSAKKTSFEELELTIPFKKLGTRTLLINAKQISSGNKQPDIFLLGIEDVTQRRLIERQKDDFVGYVTHELKTPITSLSTYLQILQAYHKNTGDKKSQEFLAKASGELDRLTNLLNSFSQVYKAQTGMLELHKEKIDLYELVKETVDTVQYTTNTHTITIDGNITKPIVADKERIRQVLINLLINAIKYSPDSPSVHVTFKEEPQKVIVSIQDYGLGIPQAAQARIFDRFFRVKDTYQSSVKGLGLGLYIAMEIVKAHHGKIKVESAEGKGATFSFSLPV